MSYDLTFWRHDQPVDRPPLEIQRALIDGQTVEGLAQLPIDDMVRRTEEVFADWTRVGADLWEQRGDGSGPAFQVYTTDQVFHVSCYGMAGADLNRLVDLGLEFDCPLYDPQTDERFT